MNAPSKDPHELGASPSHTNGKLNNHQLLPQHLGDLRASGLSDDQISRCGFHSLQAPASVQKVLNWKRYNGELGDCLVIPFTDASGNSTGYCRLKPDRPRKGRVNGKPIKYESPKGSYNLPFFPPATLAALQDAKLPLILTEGEKKAAKADQEGFPCIGLVGVFGWQKKRIKDKEGKPQGDRELIDGLASIAWQDRIVFLCFDFDAGKNANVRNAERHLVEVLKRQGATVRIVRLPPGPPGTDGSPAKVGLDDFLLANGPDAFRELLGAAGEPTPPEPGLAPIEDPDDPHRLARLFICQRCRHADGLTLRFQSERWCKWDGTAYRELPDAELRAELTSLVKSEMDRLNLAAQVLAAAKGVKPPAVRKVTRSILANIEMALASLTVLPCTVEPPAWWDGTWKRRSLIALSNGLLDPDALFAGRAEVLLPHTPRWFSETCLPYQFNADLDCPRWRAFMERNLEADLERIGLLQEWFGYCLTPDTSRQKFMVFEGEGSNGKSVVCAVLESMLGLENCSHVPLEVFGERFQLTPTMGKLANIASEVGELDKAAEGFLKSFTSGDPMQFDRKHKPPIQVIPTARLVLATNNRPRFSDRSGGLWRRMILMPFRVTIEENDPCRVLGMDKPTWWESSGELPGIFNWALSGLDRLRQQDRFTRSQVCEQALTEYRTKNNPARLFLSETCHESPEGQTSCGSLYQAYRSWCESNGYSPLADRSFGKEVKRMFTKVERRGIGGRENRFYVYCGLEADRLNGF